MKVLVHIYLSLCTQTADPNFFGGRLIYWQLPPPPHLGHHINSNRNRKTIYKEEINVDKGAKKRKMAKSEKEVHTCFGQQNIPCLFFKPGFFQSLAVNLRTKPRVLFFE